MKTKLLKRTVIFILTLLFCIPMCCFTGFADSAVSFKVQDVSGIKANNMFDVKVNYNGTSDLKISGIVLNLSYDNSKIAYSGSSEKINVKNMSGYTVNDKNGKIKFLWDSLGTVTLKQGTILTFSFQAKKTFSDTVITPTVEMLYVFEGKNIKDIGVTSVTPGALTAESGTSLADVKNVIALIEAIDNPVVLTPACNERINSAYNAYCALNGTKRQLVTNYDKLAAAIKEYNRLSEADADSPVNSEVEKFRQDYAYALSRTKLNVTTDKNADGNFKDVVALEEAIAAAEKLSVGAQVKIAGEKNTMKSVLSFLKNLVKQEQEEKDKEELEKKQRAAAEEAVNDYLSQPFKWVFDLTVDTVQTDDETGVRNAYSTLGDYEINKYAVEMLSSKKALLEELIKRIEELKASKEPEKAAEIKAADAFKDNFSYVLSLTPETVTKDDEIDINIANYAYEMLDDSVKAYLTAEGELISSLMDAVSSLPDEDGEDDGDDDTDIEAPDTDSSEDDPKNPIQQVIKHIKDAGKYTVKFINREMSKTVWVLLGAIGVLCINLGCLYGFYRHALKKEKRRTLNDENEII